MDEFEIIETAATHGPNWLMNLQTILNIVFAGTSIFGIIKWLSERKLRKINEKKEERDLDVQNFEGLVKQINYQEELIQKYIENKRKSEELEDERDRLIIEMKRNQSNYELEKINMLKELSIAKSQLCKNTICKERQS